MVSLLEVIIFSAAFGYMTAEVSRTPQAVIRFLWMLIFKKQRQSLKPFTCGICLTLWTAFFTSLFYFNFDLYQSAGIAFTASLTAALIKAIHERLL